MNRQMATGKKVLALLVSLSLMLGLAVPAGAAVSPPEDTGLTACHTAHDETCGYVAAVEGVACGCTETDADGNVVHADGCGYVEAVEGHPCGHTCQVCHPTEEPEPTQTPEPTEEPKPTQMPTVEEPVNLLSEHMEPLADFEGAGSEQDPYLIKTSADLALLASKVNGGEEYEGKYFKIADETENLSINTSIGCTPDQITQRKFNGTFDGNNKIIDVTVIRAMASGAANNCSGLFGYTDRDAVIKNVGVKGTVQGFSNSGGIVGVNDGTVENCYSEAKVSGCQVIGGVVGQNYGTVRGCFNKGPVSGTNSETGNIGGIVGQNASYGVITNCYNTAVISSVGRVVGGVVGDNMNIVKNCYNIGNPSGVLASVGGIAAENRGTVTDCVALNQTTYVTEDGIYLKGQFYPSGNFYAGRIVGVHRSGSMSNNKALSTIKLNSKNGMVEVAADKKGADKIDGADITADQKLSTIFSGSGWTSFTFNGDKTPNTALLPTLTALDWVEQDPSLPGAVINVERDPATIYVKSDGIDPSGDPSKYAGSPTDPVKTLAAALELLDNGGTVYIMDDLTLTAADAWSLDGSKRLTITSDGAAKTVKRGENLTEVPLLAVIGGEVTVTNLKLDGNTVSAAAPLVSVTSGVLTLGDGATIQNNTNTAQGAGGVLVDGGALTLTGAVTVTDNTAGGADSNVYLAGGTTMTLTGSVTGNVGVRTATAPTAGGVAFATGGTDTGAFRSDDEAAGVAAKDGGLCLTTRAADLPDGATAALDGVTLTLTVTLTEPASALTLNDENMVLDLNGQTVTGTASAPAITVTGGDVTVKNGEVKGANGTTGAGGDGISVTGGKLTIDESVTVTAGNGGEGVDGGIGLNVTNGDAVNPGTVTGGKGGAGGTGGVGIVNAGGGTVTNEGTAMGGAGTASSTGGADGVGGKAVSENVTTTGAGREIPGSDPLPGWVTSTGLSDDTAAWNAATGRLTILKDFTMTATGLVIPEGTTTVVLDLNGKTLTGHNNNPASSTFNILEINKKYSGVRLSPRALKTAACML